MATEKNPTHSAASEPPSVDIEADMQRVRVLQGHPPTGPISPDRFDDLYGPAENPSYPSKAQILAQRKNKP